MLIVELASTASPERLAARPAHRACLARLHDEGLLVAAGPWANDTGALLIFDADRATVHGVLDADSYYRVPGVKVMEIREWMPVVGPRGWGGN